MDRDGSAGARRRRADTRRRVRCRDPGRCAEVLLARGAGEGGRPLNSIVRPGAEFSQVFDEFEHTALRLEARNAYTVRRERERFQKFLGGEPDDRSWKTGWLSLVRAAAAAGRRFTP
ncbi:DUF6879 family protein [Kibdelosporangium phytohabitans]|uniref:DUF6879 family protein n=1 Tax=Kibdelosporangium phytohabitans TaxID=860235 RepID=UPI003AADA1FC